MAQAVTGRDQHVQEQQRVCRPHRLRCPGRLTYAERQRAREASQAVDEAMGRERGDTVRIKRSSWVKAWPREPDGPVQQIRNGGKGK